MPHKPNHSRTRALRPLAAIVLPLAAAACTGVPQDPPALSFDGSKAGGPIPVLRIGEANAAEALPALYAQGKAHLQAGRLGLAVHTLEAARTQAPGAVDVLNALGVTYDRLGRFDLSDRMYLDALAQGPDDPVTLNNLGWSRHLRGDTRMAAFYLAQASRAAPANPVIAANLDRTTTQQHQTFLAQASEAQDTLEEDWIERTGPREFHLTVGRVPTPLDRIELRSALALPAAVTPALQPAPVPTSPRDPVGLSSPVIVFNGAGRNGMAARIRTHLTADGLDVAAIANAESFDHRHSLIRFAASARADAQRLARFFPVTPRLVVDPDLHGATLHLVLGRDLLPFDQTLMRKETRS